MIKLQTNVNGLNSNKEGHKLFKSTWLLKEFNAKLKWFWKLYLCFKWLQSLNKT